MPLDPHQFWRDRLHTPNYKIGDAARYSHISSQTVSSWHKPLSSNREGLLSSKEKRQALSYLQLIEVAVVAQFRKAGVPLKSIRAARKYVATTLNAEHPFAEYKFKTDGKELWMDFAQIEARKGDPTLILASRGGQLGWSSIIGRLREFDYENEGLAVRWHVEGRKEKIIIDPRIQFGTPCVEGVPTWVIKDRWRAGEAIEDISDDFGLSERLIWNALAFEQIKPNEGRQLRH